MWKFIKHLSCTDFPCEVNWEQGTCSLHLQLYSANAAPGVLISVGNVGKYLLLYDQCDTFLSYGGGLTWKVESRYTWCTYVWNWSLWIYLGYS